MSDIDLTSAIRRLEKRVSALTPKESPLYEKGSFVPTLVGAGTAGTFTYTANATLVEYTRIGNRLFFNGRIVITAIAVAPVGNLSINGWPYAGVADVNMAIAGVTAIEWARVILPAGFTAINVQFGNSAVAALVRSGQNVGLATVQGAELGAAPYDFRFGGNYKIV